MLLAPVLAAVAAALMSGRLLNKLPASRREAAAVGLLLAGMALFAWAAPPLASRLASRKRDAAPWLPARTRLYASAIATYLLSLALYWFGGESYAVRIAWLLGMGLLVAAHIKTWQWPRLSREDGRDLILLTLITAIGFVLRYWRLPQLPDFVHGDIASQGLQALAILSGEANRLFDVGWSNIPMLDYALMAGTMKLFGRDLFGLSMTAVWQGVLTLPALYLLGREMFGRRVGLIAAALLAISYTHIHFSRFVTTASPLLAISLTFFFLFRGMRLRRGAWFALAGISLGVGMMVYYPIRAAVVVIGALFLWLLLWQRDRVKDDLGHWLAFAVGALLGFGPMLGFVAQNFRTFVGRGNLVTLFNPAVMEHLMSKYGASTATAVWLEQTKRSLLTFYSYGDSSTHFAFRGPIVSALTAVLFALGLAYALRHLRDERSFTLVTWVGSVLVLGSIITNDAPFWPHIVIMLPAVALLAAWAAERICSGVSQALPEERRGQADRIMAGLLTLFILFAGAKNWQAYLAHVESNATPELRIARYLVTLSPDRRVILVKDPYDWPRREFQFFGQHLQGADFPAEHLLDNPIPDPQVPTVFIVTPNHQDVLAALMARFPEANVHEHKDGRGAPAFFSIDVAPPGYVSPPDAVAPIATLPARQRLVWGLAILLFIAALAAGVYLYLHRAPTPSPAPSLAPSPTQPPAPSPTRPLALSPTRPPAPTRSLETPILDRGRLTLALTGMGVALALAYLAQSFFVKQAFPAAMAGLLTRASLPSALSSPLNLAAVLYLAAMILFALAAPPLAHWVTRRPRPQPRRPRHIPGPNRPDAVIIPPQIGTAPVQEQERPAEQKETRVRWLWLAAALVPYALSMVRFARAGENASVRWLWIAGLVIFLAGQVIWPWLRGRGQRVADAMPSPRFQRHHAAVLAIILLAGFWLRFNNLTAIPHDFHGDMASHGLQARAIIEGVEPNIFKEGWANIPMLAFVPASISLRVFGNDLFGLRMTSVIGGMVGLLALYLLTWRLFDSHRLAALATAALAINTPHIHFSRIAEYIDPWLFLLPAMFFIVDGLKARRAASLALAGVLFGLGMQMYYSGRVIIPFLLVAFIYLAMFHRDWLKGGGWGISMLIVGGFLALGPSLIYFAEHREAFLERSRSVFLFYPPVMEHLMGKYGVDSVQAVVLEQIRRSLLMFNHSIDSSTQFGYPHPMFSALLAPLVILGVGYSLRWIRRAAPALILIWLFNILILGSILTNNAPFWPRLVGVLPAAAIMAALTIDRVWEAIEQLTHGERLVNLTLALLAGAFLVYAGQANWRLYYETVQNNARPRARIGRYLASLPPQVAACGFRDPYELRVRETYFQAWPRQILDLPADAPAEMLQRCPGPPLVWILAPPHISRLPEIQARWPGGVMQEHYDANGVLVFVSYLVGEGLTTESPPTDLPPQPTSPPPAAAPPPPAVTEGYTAYMPDGTDFAPELTFQGNTSSTVWRVALGEVTVEDGQITLYVGPLPGQDAVYDYVEFIAADGTTHRFEAEDPTYTTGDAYSEREGADGHWWLQNYGPFSDGQGLVAQKNEMVPALITTVELPNGTYEVYIGSFTGDPNNGVFGLGVRWER